MSGSSSTRPFSADDAPAVRAIMAASLATDEIPGFTADDIERAMVRILPDPDGTVVAVEDGVVVGYCTPHHDDLTVLPGSRRRGHGRRLVDAARALARARGQRELQLYVPPHLPASVAFAGSIGLAYRSSLWMFVLPATHPVSAARFEPDVVTRTWEPQRDVDLEAWTAFLHQAFEGHPTPMTWTTAVIRGVHAAPDFDPSGILIVAAADAPDVPVAFARVEMFERDRPAGERVGDIGLLGVVPAWRGRGLGRTLLRWGVATLRARGAGRIELSVEAANERATGLYRAHGFEPTIEWPHWVIATDG